MLQNVEKLRSDFQVDYMAFTKFDVKVFSTLLAAIRYAEINPDVITIRYPNGDYHYFWEDINKTIPTKYDPSMEIKTRQPSNQPILNSWTDKMRDTKRKER